MIAIPEIIILSQDKMRSSDGLMISATMIPSTKVGGRDVHAATQPVCVRVAIIVYTLLLLRLWPILLVA